jgi:hypothetical protein
MTWKKLALAAEPKIESARAQQFSAEIAAGQHRSRADKMQELARETLALMRLVINGSDARMAPGVYFLLSKTGQVLYVGQAENVLLRMGGHRDKDFHSVRMIHVPRPGERDRLEQRFIHLLTPPINIALTGRNECASLLENDALSLAQKPSALSVEAA